jgi:hypothetical protein
VIPAFACLGIIYLDAVNTLCIVLRCTKGRVAMTSIFFACFVAARHWECCGARIAGIFGLGVEVGKEVRYVQHLHIPIARVRASVAAETAGRRRSAGTVH